MQGCSVAFCADWPGKVKVVLIRGHGGNKLLFGLELFAFEELFLHEVVKALDVGVCVGGGGRIEVVVCPHLFFDQCVEPAFALAFLTASELCAVVGVDVDVGEVFAALAQVFEEPLDAQARVGGRELRGVGDEDRAPVGTSRIEYWCRGKPNRLMYG